MQNTTKAQRVFLIDQHLVVRQGLFSVLKADPNWQVVGQAGTLNSAIEQLSTLQPDVILTDIGLSNLPGDELCRRLLHASPQSQLIVLCAYLGPTLIADCLRAGATACVEKDINCLLRIKQLSTAHSSPQL